LTPYPARTTSEEPEMGRQAMPMRGEKSCLSERISDEG